jgi:hypothetical protein
MKSKKNGTKENVGKWFLFLNENKIKRKEIITQRMFFFFISFLFCFATIFLIKQERY